VIRLGLSLRSKVFFLFSGAALLTVVPALFLIARAVEERVYERATDELARAGEALAVNWDRDDEVLLQDARLRALEPEVPELLAEADTVRLQRLLSRRLADGRVVLAADSAGQRLLGPAPDSATLWRSVGLGSIITMPEADGYPLRIAVWPVWADGRLVGVVGVGTRLDARIARRLDEASGNDVAVIVEGRLVASTLADTATQELEGVDLPMIIERGGTWKRMLDSRWYLYRVQPLRAQGAPISVLLFRPVGDELRIARGIRSSLIGIGFVTLLLSLALAGLVARIVARPAQALAEAATQLAHGDYGAPLPPDSGDEIGQLTRTFGEMRSAIAEREARLRSAQAEMIHREKLAAMGRLVAQLSHEINNPIYNIQNCLEALQRRGDPDDPNREFLDLAQEELSRMAVLTRQLLDQSRPLSDAAEPLDLSAMAKRVVLLAQPRLDAHAIRVDLRFDAALPTVVVHPDAIQQVLANLVDNAVDVMLGGGTLRLETRATGDFVEISVEDTGPGIPDEQLSRIFEAFYTTKPGVRGIGLGLFVSEGIVRGHRGRLLVESRMGKGSRFVVQLPRQTLGRTLAALPGDDAGRGTRPRRVLRTPGPRPARVPGPARSPVNRGGAAMPDAARILIIDDDRAFRIGTGALLVDEGYAVDAATGGDEGLALLRDARYDLVLLDLRMEGRSGLSVLDEIRRSGSDVPVLMLTGFATVDSAVQALKLGADDYITKPCDNDRLRSKIRVVLARREPVLGSGASGIVAVSSNMREVLKSVARVAPTESTVLLRGATGTGKELVARAIHEESSRASRPFLAINCSALAEGLLESELFGHARGAFTGAVSERKGVFEEAAGGTVFLDEIGDISPGMQARLLRVLQEREVTRVGTSRPVSVDVRIIAATHQDLEAMVEAERFRADLYFRLKVFQIRIPRLRERPSDVPALTSAAMTRWNERITDASRRIAGCSDEAIELLQAYDWPGNVRELMAAVEHACIVCDGGRILACHLPEEIRDPGVLTEPDQERRASADPSRRYQAPAPDTEREIILQALEEADGNRTRAAAILGMGRTTLWQKLKAYGLDDS